MTTPSPAEQRPIVALGTTLGRARCHRPTLVERMRQSMSAQGRLQPVVVVDREGKLELVDGFKRKAAATALGWPTLQVPCHPAGGPPFARPRPGSLLAARHPTGSLPRHPARLATTAAVGQDLTATPIRA